MGKFHKWKDNTRQKRIDNVIVESVDQTGSYVVRWGEGVTDCMTLFGISRPSENVSVGDIGYLVYSVGPSYGLWTFIKNTTKND